MCPCRTWLLICMLLGVAVFVSVGAADSHTPTVRAALENVSLASVNADGVQLTVTLSLTSSQNLTLREIIFDRLRVNGVPFYATPISDRLVLVPNQKIVPPNPLTLTVYLRDIESLDPLRSLVTDEKVTITGMAYADFSLGGLAKLVLFANHARVPVRIDSTVDVQVPGGSVGRKAALAILDRAGAGWEQAGSRWQTAARFFSQWRKQLWDQYAPALVLAYATYELADNSGKKSRLDATATGFRVGGKQVLVPKSVLEPWKFDPYIIGSMKQNPDLKVAGYDLWIWPANAGLRDGSNQLSSTQAWRLSTQQLRLLPFTRDDTETMLLPVEGKHPMKVSVHRRQGASALGIVEIIDPAVQPVTITLDASHCASHFDSLALFRFPGGVDASESRPDLVFVSATCTPSKLELDTRIDSSGWGSPVISKNGVVGILIDENCVVPIAEAEQLLNFKSDGIVTGK